MLLIPVVVVAILAAIASYVLMVCVATKLRPFRGNSTNSSTAVAHRTAVPEGSPAEEAADAVQDTSYHPPPVPVVVLDPDGRLTVAYLLRVSNQSYLVTQKSSSEEVGSRASLADRSLSLPTTLPPDRSLSLPATLPPDHSLSLSINRSLSPAVSLPPEEQYSSGDESTGGSGSTGDSACSEGGATSGGSEGIGRCEVDSAWAGSEPDIEQGLGSKGAGIEGPATPAAAERRRSSASTGGLPAVEACLQVWAPACE